MLLFIHEKIGSHSQGVCVSASGRCYRAILAVQCLFLLTEEHPAFLWRNTSPLLCALVVVSCRVSFPLATGEHCVHCWAMVASFPGLWVSNSIHPNEKGNAGTRRFLSQNSNETINYFLLYFFFSIITGYCPFLGLCVFPHTFFC